MQNQKIVQEALDKASMGRTTVVVAHRLSTVRNADIIAVVQSGGVIETGRHEEFIHKPNGTYAALAQLQQVSSKNEQTPTNSISMSITQASITPANILTAKSSRHGSQGGSERSSQSRRIFPEQENPDEEENNKTEIAKKRSIPSFRRLLALNAPEWKHTVLGCMGAIGYGALQPAYAFTLGSMISVLFLKDEDEMKQKVKVYCAIFVCLSMWSFMVSFLQHYNFAAMGELLTRRIRLMLLRNILTLEIGWFDRDENSSGALCSKLGTDANMVRSLVADRLSLLTEAVSAVGIACILSLFIAWRLALVVIAMQPLIITCYYTRNVLLRNISKKSIKAQEQGCQVAAESVVNHRTITALCSQDRILRLFDSTQEGPHKEINRESWYAGLGLATSQALTILNWAMDFWYGGKLIHQGIITSEDLLKTLFVLIRSGRIIADAGSMTSDLTKSADAVDSVFTILDKNTLICPDDPKGIKPQILEGNVDMEKVDFAYPARPNIIIFQNFCLRVKAGSSMALVGQSGCGKSTIIGLIERFYDPQKGRVNIDGKDIRSFNLRTLRQHIALVGQEPTLFVGSIREIIAYGKEDATEAEVIEAAKAANAHEFISCLKDGYYTNTGERGMQMSGGQKQRIAIARAIIKNPSILLLDEATSALDSQSEKVVQEALDRVMIGRTSVIVAHRLNTIQNSDCIVVIEKGRIVEQGSHSQLLSKGDGGRKTQRECKRGFSGREDRGEEHGAGYAGRAAKPAHRANANGIGFSGRKHTMKEHVGRSSKPDTMQRLPWRKDKSGLHVEEACREFSKTRQQRRMCRGVSKTRRKRNAGFEVGKTRRGCTGQKHVEHPSGPDAHAGSSSAPTQKKARNHVGSGFRDNASIEHMPGLLPNPIRSTVHHNETS
ncbi:hypothetical protein KI387_043419 [Taxus chinensis]|uniref:Uncharacterized protein n=1 Tax=Taxus chinensis TaxID=29808 RepID=A0AA38BYI1_TAXCH|nr:hypothetical protein KI387_043419 [Taxus chinensis]